MKKIVAFTLLLFVAVSPLLAQDATTSGEVIKNKKGFAILPEAGEWGLGASAQPFLRYMGNFFHGNNVNNPATFDYASNPANNIALFGKYVVDANTQYRVRFNITKGTSINKAVVGQDLLNPNPSYPAFTEDWQKVNGNTVVIAAGYEKRRGKTRLQGVYGGELVFGLNSTKTEYQYGNSIQLDFQNPTRKDFGTNKVGANGWVTEDKSGTNFLVGARGFIGVEYFFAPKMSLGGEFGYMLAYRTQGKGRITSESWNGGINGITTITTDKYENSGLQYVGIGLDNLSGSINLLFYF